jgi:hypothetical protein
MCERDPGSQISPPRDRFSWSECNEGEPAALPGPRATAGLPPWREEPCSCLSYTCYRPDNCESSTCYGPDMDLFRLVFLLLFRSISFLCFRLRCGRTIDAAVFPPFLTPSLPAIGSDDLAASGSVRGADRACGTIDESRKIYYICSPCIDADGLRQTLLGNLVFALDLR